MINELANFLNNPPQHVGMQISIAILGFLIVIAGFIVGLMSLGHTVKSNLGKVVSLGIMVFGTLTVGYSGEIVEQLYNDKLQTEIDLKVQAIDNEYPYQLSIADSNNNVYFVFCKTKDSQNKVIKTMNTGDNPTIKYSNDVATYINISQHIENGTQVEKQIKEKDLLDIMKNNFN